MKPASPDIIAIIDEYIACATQCKDLLEFQFNLTGKSIICAYRAKEIPRSGWIGSVYYQFHGVGCYFKLRIGEIDVDFGENNRSDGIDEFRLLLFYNSHNLGSKYGFSNQELIKLFQEVVNSGVLVKSNCSPIEHLYFKSET